MIEIPLTQGKVAIIDVSDYSLVKGYKWHYSLSSKNYGRAITRPDKNKPAIRMHRLIMSAPIGLEVDHINGNPLDNRRSNLCLVTHSQNQKNMRKPITNKSGYKGVSWHTKSNKWQAHLMNNGKRHYLGLFIDLKEAAKAYNIAALELFGEFAKINEIKD